MITARKPQKRLRVRIRFWLTVVFGTTVFNHACADSSPARVVDQVATSAGLLQVEELERGCRYRVVLGAKEILQSDCERRATPADDAPIPAVHTYYKSGIEPFVDVVLLQQQMLGNACNGGPFWLVALRPDKSFFVSKLIDYCGGAPAEITWTAQQLELVFPSAPLNRGAGTSKTERWRFKEGVLRQIKPQ